MSFGEHKGESKGGDTKYAGAWDEDAKFAGFNPQTCLSKLVDGKSNRNTALEVIDIYASILTGTKEWADLPEADLLAIMNRDTLNIEEGVLFDGVIAWGHAECVRKKLAVSDDNLKKVLASALLLIRFPTMKIQEVSEKVTNTKVIDTTQMLELFSYIAIKDSPGMPTPPLGKNIDMFNPRPRRGRKAPGTWIWPCPLCKMFNPSARTLCMECPGVRPKDFVAYPPSEGKVAQNEESKDSKPWNCSVCTFENRAGMRTCATCHAVRADLAPLLKRELSTPGWNCPKCTMKNALEAKRCNVCNALAPEPEEKVDSKETKGGGSGGGSTETKSTGVSARTGKKFELPKVRNVRGSSPAFALQKSLQFRTDDPIPVPQWEGLGWHSIPHLGIYGPSYDMSNAMLLVEMPTSIGALHRSLPQSVLRGMFTKDEDLIITGPGSGVVMTPADEKRMKAAADAAAAASATGTGSGSGTGGAGDGSPAPVVAPEPTGMGLGLSAGVGHAPIVGDPRHWAERRAEREAKEEEERAAKEAEAKAAKAREAKDGKDGKSSDSKASSETKTDAKSETKSGESKSDGKSSSGSTSGSTGSSTGSSEGKSGEGKSEGKSEGKGSKEMKERELIMKDRSFEFYVVVHERLDFNHREEALPGGPPPGQPAPMTTDDRRINLVTHPWIFRTIGFKTEFNENTRAWMGCYEPVGIMEPRFHDPDVPAEPGVIYDGGALPFNRLMNHDVVLHGGHFSPCNATLRLDANRSLHSWFSVVHHPPRCVVMFHVLPGSVEMHNLLVKLIKRSQFLDEFLESLQETAMATGGATSSDAKSDGKSDGKTETKATDAKSSDSKTDSKTTDSKTDSKSGSSVGGSGSTGAGSSSTGGSGSGAAASASSSDTALRELCQRLEMILLPAFTDRDSTAASASSAGAGSKTTESKAETKSETKAESKSGESKSAAGSASATATATKG